jgi:ABC-type branched-subunit amino acid transport system ATPase component
MKRRLSVAIIATAMIALLGDPKIVYLDEPIRGEPGRQTRHKSTDEAVPPRLSSLSCRPPAAALVVEVLYLGFLRSCCDLWDHCCANCGGMKWRLSVAIALLGDPKIVYLDEPTRGQNQRWH